MEKDTTCSAYRYRSWRCIECLAIRSLDADPSIFITKKYLIFSLPKYILILEDIGLKDNTITNYFAVLGNFLLFLLSAIKKIRGEILYNNI